MYQPYDKGELTFPWIIQHNLIRWMQDSTLCRIIPVAICFYRE